MKKIQTIIIIPFLLVLIHCGSGDLKKINQHVDQIFKIKQSGVYNDLEELIHPQAKEDLKIELFAKLFDKQKEILGEAIEYNREKFNYKSTSETKIYDVFYEVKYSKKDIFWERFTFQSDETNQFKLIGYAGNENRESVNPKSNKTEP
ncbi:MAG: hypothetical protein JJT78_04815 [Leptospira sp.]|nr:hypothetical protein [Leptospira sp.]